MTTLGQVIADISRDKDDMKRDFGMAGSITNFVNFYPQSITITNPYTLVSIRGLGSSFILGHSGLGWIGPPVAGSITCGSQPYLGDSRGSWGIRRIVSFRNVFIETFNGSRFMSGATTADWAVGSLVFTSGERMTTENIYLGAGSLSSIKLDLTGSTYSNLSLEASPDGGDNWENVSAGSVDTYSFVNSGSELQLRFTEDVGEGAILTRFGVRYVN